MRFGPSPDGKCDVFAYLKSLYLNSIRAVLVRDPDWFCHAMAGGGNEILPIDPPVLSTGFASDCLSDYGTVNSAAP